MEQVFNRKYKNFAKNARLPECPTRIERLNYRFYYSFLPKHIIVINRCSHSGEVESTGIHDIRMIFALLHLMEPQTTTLKDKTVFRPTIPSAKERLLNKVLDQSQIKGIVNLITNDRQKNN